jgi:hypothetical protein
MNRGLLEGATTFNIMTLYIMKIGIAYMSCQVRYTCTFMVTVVMLGVIVLIIIKLRLAMLSLVN